MNKKVTLFHFSPGGTTAKIGKEFTAVLGSEVETIDLLQNKALAGRTFAQDDMVVVALPVFSGRIPKMCPKMLAKWKGSNTPAVLLAVYGNRDYDDALLEMQDILTENGFVVIGAGAFVARHSVMPQVAAGRPDAQDSEKLIQFAQQCKAKLEQEAGNCLLEIKGNRPYREIVTLPLKPAGSSACTKCNACVKICPTGAISEDNPRKTDKARCITCTACIYACPVQARNFRGAMYRMAKNAFQKKCMLRKEPEIFI